MRGLSVRRIASSALCGALLLGLAGPAAVAAETQPARDRVQAASQAPVPGADGLLAQVQSLGNLGAVLTPVTDLLNAVLKADNGQLSAEEATKLGDAVKAAIEKVSAAPAAPAVPSVPSVPAVPAVPATPALPQTPTSSLPTGSLPAVPTLPSLSTSGDDSKAGASAKLPADLVADALAGLQKAVDTLLAAATSGDVTQVVPAVTGVLTGLVNVLAATLLSGKLPLPDLPGLPALPSAPGLPTLPTGSLPTSPLPAS
ncbi:hypothetical protein [Streptomyces griseorubiginosus]|uniref:hypothetical protein n=1 Tax=Streptomyces griseorubiginosus TaxID=67304 RepID=UPI002E7FB809|nr:hypothetical protein [Streptomyces griseorubiginosus]WUB46971.1 hypothetical protein OHN19_28010 [Streptomyces griseorubiginosus]WUB55493.1 hypothetical protein OG942_28015 [Streptomyces griseorubiginosus]